MIPLPTCMNNIACCTTTTRLHGSVWAALVTGIKRTRSRHRVTSTRYPHSHCCATEATLVCCCCLTEDLAVTCCAPLVVLSACLYLLTWPTPWRGLCEGRVWFLCTVVSREEPHLLVQVVLRGGPSVTAPVPPCRLRGVSLFGEWVGESPTQEP